MLCSLQKKFIKKNELDVENLSKEQLQKIKDEIVENLRFYFKDEYWNFVEFAKGYVSDNIYIKNSSDAMEFLSINDETLEKSFKYAQNENFDLNELNSIELSRNLIRGSFEEYFDKNRDEFFKKIQENILNEVIEKII